MNLTDGALTLDFDSEDVLLVENFTMNDVLH